MSIPAVHTRKKRMIVLDTETTGKLTYDRIVTLGAVRLEGDELQRESLYLIFDPSIDSHPEAIESHGYDNWMTRFQDLFSDLAPRIHTWLSWADELVMHDCRFAMRYLQRELCQAGVAELTQPTSCTMERAGELWGRESSDLDECLKRIGKSRIYRIHGALEDAYLTAALYLHQIGSKRPIARVNSWSPPKNLKPHPPRPPGELPSRTEKKRLGTIEDAHLLLSQGSAMASPLQYASGPRSTPQAHSV
ncbi:exonuclease domain-containing protein [Phyllobacterium zundukense]|uniref:DNA polymerase III subunit epsilon n=1 Tax=Phyllobacterium zundukense TaxID=1867719 RepID=A0A2N9W2U3_9HYPH|nr:exonuclease domain-containing protein [Phyllobacterium zundukense]ATU94609.1 DNA polymerase III subunit epsilon [Phyllobacterium zundukense]PIO46061.1 DNA polymerase III subunit epsilon [Phyllobacterium zundukense]